MRKTLESFIELIYPEINICFICDSFNDNIGKKYICNDCENKLIKLLKPCCVKCSKEIRSPFEVNLCKDCFINEKFFETSKSVFRYKGIIKSSIYSFKYHNKPYFYKMFGNFLTTYMKKENYTNFDYIMSVPIHYSKLLIRGYNQTELLAKYISKTFNIKYIDGLKRIKKTTKQSDQSRNERKRNLQNAFSIKHSPNIDDITNSSILLIDDVYTTGVTLNECSRILLDFGVRNVYGLTIAR